MSAHVRACLGRSMLGSMFVWAFLSFLWFKIAFDQAYLVDLETLAAAVMGVMTALFTILASRIYANTPRVLWPIALVILIAVLAGTSACIVSGFSKGLYYSLFYNAAARWEAYPSYHKEVYKFAALAAVPMTAHLLFRVCEALYRRHEAVGDIPSKPDPSGVATTHVVTCLKCGQKNRVPNRFGTATCANCKEVIEVNLPRSWLETLRWPLHAPALTWASVWALALVWAIVIEVNKPERPRATALPPAPLALRQPPQSKPALNPVEASTGFFSAPVGPRLPRLPSGQGDHTTSS